MDRNVRRVKQGIGVPSRDARAGIRGLNLDIAVPHEELRRKIDGAHLGSLSTLVQNIATSKFREEVLEQEEGTIRVCTKIRSAVWLQWRLRVPPGVSPRAAMGKALTLWCKQQPMPKENDGWLDPWLEQEVMEKEDFVTDESD